MGSLPQPTIAYNPQPPADPLAQYGKMVQISNLLNAGQEQKQDIQAKTLENQQRQIALISQQGKMRAIAQWTKEMQDAASSSSSSSDFGAATKSDSSTPIKATTNAQAPYDRLADLYAENKVLPDDILALRKDSLELQQKHELTNKDALANRSTVQGNIDQALAAIQGIKDPDPSVEEQKQSSAWTAVKPDLVKQAIDYGLPDLANHMNQFQYAGPQSLDQARAYNGAGKQMADMAKTQAETAEAGARAVAARFEHAGGAFWDMSGSVPKLVLPNDMGPAAVRGSLLNAADQIQNSSIKSNTRIQIDTLLQQGNLEGAQAALKEGLSKEAEIAAQNDPRTVATKLALQKEEQIVRQGPLTVPQNAAVVKLEDAATKYSQTLAQLMQAKQVIADAKTGDELAAKLVPMEDLLGIQSISARGTARLNQGLLSATGPQVGSVARRAEAFFKGLRSGTLPGDTTKEADDLMNEMIKARYADYQRQALGISASVSMPSDHRGYLDQDGNVVSLADFSPKTKAKTSIPSAAPKSWTTPKGASLGSTQDLPNDFPR